MITALLLAVLLAQGTPVADATNSVVEPSEPVVAHAAFSYDTFGSMWPGTLLLRTDFSASSLRSTRPPLNVALVLDRSASMNEDEKFGHALAAAREVVRNMTDRDRLSIIAFNEGVVVLSPSARVVNKPYLFHRLEEVPPRGHTDLSAGLLEGIAQVEDGAADGQVRQVLLLTDGVANAGVTDPNALEGMVEKAAARGIHLSTLGCGTDFNEELLADLATAGGGRYTFVKSPEQLPMAFAGELHGLLQTAAQNVTVRITVRGGRIVRVYGRLLGEPATSYRFDIGDLRATERGAFLLEVSPIDREPDSSVEADVVVTYDDPASARRLSRVLKESSLFSTSTDAPLGRQDVLLYGAVLGALEKAEEAAIGLDVDRYLGARSAFERHYDRAHRHAVLNRDQELLNQVFVLKHFMKELSTAEREGLLHDHEDARERLKKEAHYRRYLLNHHRAVP